jgi:hypothetical protein
LTDFIADISSYQRGLDLSRLTDCIGVIAKVTEGDYYFDDCYNGWRAQAKQLGKLFVAYDFVRADEGADVQAAWIAAHIGDPAIPLMLDVETEGTSKPSFAQVVALIKACKARELRVKLVYLPRWYWEQIGSPDMSELTDLGVMLVSSAYPGGSGTAVQIYPGPKAAGWNKYGNVAPLLYQFTSTALDGGQKIDMNAYEGDRTALVNFLTGGSIMSNIPPTIGQKWPEIATEFPANAPFDNDGALIWADGGARAAALYAKQARDAINTLAQKLTTPAPAVDVKALAAALAPLLATAPTADQVAAAVAQHFAADLAKG